MFRRCGVGSYRGGQSPGGNGDTYAYTNNAQDEAYTTASSNAGASSDTYTYANPHTDPDGYTDGDGYVYADANSVTQRPLHPLPLRPLT